jgi:hypothetical protein
MTKNLSENLVNLRDFRFGANAGAKLGLNHVKGGLHIRPLMVVREELLAVISEKVVHPAPQLPAVLGDTLVGPRLVPIGAPGVVVALEGISGNAPAATTASRLEWLI